MKLHLDLDSFFVSAHRSIDKSLCNKPVVVVKRNDREIFENVKSEVLNLNRGAFTGDLVISKKNLGKDYFLEDGKVRGIVVTASYEAREFGIKTGTTLKEALEICPTLEVIVPDYRLYHTLSYKLKLFLKKRIPEVEQYSIDEFFGDVSGWVKEDEVFKFAKNLQQEIKDKFDLPISIGIAKSKWIAKLATSFAKPNGVFKVENVEEFIRDIPIEKFPGIGKRIEKKLKSRGVVNLIDLKYQKDYLFSWGKPGIMLYKRIFGEDEEEIKERVFQKSIGISRKFDPIYSRVEVYRRLQILCRYLSFLVTKKKVNPTFYYLKIKYSKGSSKAKKRVFRLFSEKLLRDIMYKLFIEADRENSAVIGLGLSVGMFKSVTNLFDYKEDFKLKKINQAIYKIRSRFGVSSIISAGEIIPC